MICHSFFLNILISPACVRVVNLLRALPHEEGVVAEGEAQAGHLQPYGLPMALGRADPPEPGGHQGQGQEQKLNPHFFSFFKKT